MDIGKIIRDLNIKQVYSSMYGNLDVLKTTVDGIVLSYKHTPIVFRRDGSYGDNNECTLFPFKEMRDWSKISWTYGDILVNDRFHCIFSRWADPKDHFVAKYSDYSGCVQSIECTSKWHIESSAEKKNQYIKELEDLYRGVYIVNTATIQPLYYFDDAVCSRLKANTDYLSNYLNNLKVTSASNVVQEDKIGASFCDLVDTSIEFRGKVKDLLIDFKKTLYNENT